VRAQFVVKRIRVRAKLRVKRIEFRFAHVLILRMGLCARNEKLVDQPKPPIVSH
jgi:hypothetical protein